MVTRILDEDALETRIDSLGSTFNGIELVLVDLEPQPSPTQAILWLHFHNDNVLDDIVTDVTADPTQIVTIFPIRGGQRLPAGPLPEQVKVVDVQDTTEDNVLRLAVEPIGDYSTYTLGVVYDDIDPLLSEIPFKFRPGCFNLCAPDWEKPPEPKTDPPIDYLAKDFDSFRHTMIAWMMDRVPNWEATSEADFDQVLIELFSAAADELSDYQDRVMNEAYLTRARKRVSLARHARLMDYHIHQGNQANTWLALTLEDDTQLALTDRLEVGTGADLKDSSSVIFLSKEAPDSLFSMEQALQVDLDGGGFTAALRAEFEAALETLSATVSVTVLSPGERWLVTDDGEHRSFYLRMQDGLITVYAANLNSLLNEMRLYTWGDSVPALEAGATQAELLVGNGDEDEAKAVETLIRDGTIEYLLVQEYLNPATGKVGGRDPEKRQLLKLLSSEKGAKAELDPVENKWFLRVEWEEKDKLWARYCFITECASGLVEDVSLFHGNLVQVYHGRGKEVIFREPGTLLTEGADPKEYHFERLEDTKEEKIGPVICQVPDQYLAYRDTPPSGEVPPQSTLEVKIESGGEKDAYDEVITLVHSGNGAERGDHFLVETDEMGYSALRFGDGGGTRLPEGASVLCWYQSGWGPDGNVGQDALSLWDKDTYPEIESCWNPFDVTNGRAPEPVAEILRRVPEAYRYRQLRAVTLKDYVNRAEELSEVSKAAARYMWTGSWRTVRVTIDPLGASELSEELEEKVRRHLEAVRLIGEDLEIRPPRFVPLDIIVTLCVETEVWPLDIKEYLEMEFSTGYTPDGRMAFFHPDRWTFGQKLHESEILGRVQAVQGVDHVISVQLKRWNEDTPGTKKEIKVQPNEIVQVMNDPDHKEHGTIQFELEGGRG